MPADRWCRFQRCGFAAAVAHWGHPTAHRPPRSACEHPAHSSADAQRPRLNPPPASRYETERVGYPPVKSFLYVLPTEAGATLGDASWVPESTCETGSRHQAQSDLIRLTPSAAQRSRILVPFHSPAVPAGHEYLRRIQCRDPRTTDPEEARRRMTVASIGLGTLGIHH